MLNLNIAERAQLSTDGSLWHDANGHESLVGLTSRESKFVLLYQKTFNDRQTAAHQNIYSHLRQKHAAAHATVCLSRAGALGTQTEALLDEALADSFPASDPVAISITSINVARAP
ncbi:hypothetical protein KW842_01920 [Duganella sp. sic0402]|uniref:hypothetical protein n=1 Tax=Duganella sp. sic0402 TaxID=2854786 RepID=UPI001C45D155|nr:hypothetical protein [Duganella sp. sic0402]MBV7534514.1 hypothetical protein [Duganella sp. sic0402]